MSEILLLNPRRKAKTRRKKKAAAKKAAAKKRTARKRPVRRTKRAGISAKRKGASMATRKRRKTTKRRAPRRNPSRRRRRNPKRIVRRASSAVKGLNFKTALKNIPIHTLGMLAAKWAAKKFGTAASETDPASWNYASYLKGSAGAALAAFIANVIKPGTGQRVLEGGMSLMLYKLAQNELIASNAFWAGQFGEADYQYDRVPGAIEENEAGESYILGEDYQWYPLEGYGEVYDRQGVGGELVEPGPLGYAGALVAPGPLGYGADESEANLNSLYTNSFLRR
jgi:hypothetical protein